MPQRSLGTSVRRCTTRRKVVWAVIIVLILLAGGFIASHKLKTKMGRFYAYAPYLDAILHYGKEYGHFPESLADLEAAYNGSDVCKIELPVAGYKQPAFRPINGLDNDRYLVIIEPKPDELFQYDRLLIYVKHDLSRGDIEFVPEREVSRRIAEDDRLRAESMSRPAGCDE